MVLGKIFRLAVDGIAISAVIAGVKKSTGFAPDTAQIPDSSFRAIADGYFGIGETVFNIAAGQAVTSGWFKRTGV